MSEKLNIQKLIEVLGKEIGSIKEQLIYAINEAVSEKTTAEKPTLTLKCEVGLEFVSSNYYCEIIEIDRFGIIIVFSSVQKNKNDLDERTLDDLNVSHLYDLLIAVEETESNQIKQSV